MTKIKIGILKEGKTPPDKRVPLTPFQCKKLISQYPNLCLVVQKSSIRCFDDKEYAELGVTLVEDVSSKQTWLYANIESTSEKERTLIKQGNIRFG